MGLIALVSGALGCATTPSRVPQPIAHVGGKPLTLDILGRRYTVPPRLDVVDHLRQAGVFALKMQDSINRCQTEMLFVTTTDSERHEKRFHAAADEEVAGRRRQGLTVDERTSAPEVLSRKAAVRTLFLSRAGDRAASVHLSVYLPERQLGVSSHTFCDDEGFAEMATALQLKLLRSGGTGPSSQPVTEQRSAQVLTP
jgi:hypothetical protein